MSKIFKQKQLHYNYYKKTKILSLLLDNSNHGKNIKTKPAKANATILGNKTLLRYFRKFKNTTINENIDLLEY